MQTSDRLRISLFFVAALACGLGSFFSIQPFPVAVDVAFHIRFLNDFHQAWNEGNGFPDWDARPFEGRGTAAFRYYAPAVYVLGSLFMSLGFTVFSAIKMVVFCYALIGGLGVIRWMEALELSHSKVPALFFFFCCPIFSAHLFQMFFFQNLCAVLLFTWVFDGWERIRTDKAGVVQTGLFLGIIGFTHLPAALMAGYSLIFLSLVSFAQQRQWKPFGKTVLAIILSGGIMSPYALPAMTGLQELSFHKLDGNVPWATQNFLDDSIYVQGKNEVFHLIRGVFRLGFLGLLVSGIPAIWLIIVKRKYWKRFLAYALSGLFLLLLNLRFSLLIWEIIPKISVLQYPWRWLWPSYLMFLPIASDFISIPSEKTFYRLLKVIGIFGFTGLLALSFTVQYYRKPLPDVEQVMCIAYFYPPEYLPKTMKTSSPPPQQAGPIRTLVFMDASGRALPVKHQFAKSVWNCEVLQENVKIEIGTHYDPWWVLTASGTALTTSPSIPQGLIQASLPHGTYELILSRKTLPKRTLGWITFFLTLACGFFFHFGLDRKTRNQLPHRG